ncbi:UNVERIFIED_CONTAM: hypothetical protein Sradi_1864500 [Sesamum radiatum]|uniref:Uncharacterized protein n=1 Tax=Sesamum radiatum TaxID=300843 RepID=A0AAW2U0Z6_SESRA
MREICSGFGTRLPARQREFWPTRGMVEVGGWRHLDWMGTWPKARRRIFRARGAAEQVAGWWLAAG